MSEPSAPTSPARDEVLHHVAGLVSSTVLDHPTRVAVEGITASGKSTFAQQLAAAVRAHGRPARTLSMDGFHHPAAHRRRQGPLSPDGYFEDAYDLDALREQVLVPLGPGGDRRIRPALIDLDTDTPVDPDPVELDPDEVLVVDGSFLAVPELVGHWDRRVWLDVPFPVARTRGVARDAERLGGEEAAEAAFAQRYHAAFRRYLAELRPDRTADVVVEHADPLAPTVRRLATTG